MAGLHAYREAVAGRPEELWQRAHRAVARPADGDTSVLDELLDAWHNNVERFYVAPALHNAGYADTLADRRLTLLCSPGPPNRNRAGALGFAVEWGTPFAELERIRHDYEAAPALTAEIAAREAAERAQDAVDALDPASDPQTQRAARWQLSSAVTDVRNALAVTSAALAAASAVTVDPDLLQLIGAVAAAHLRALDGVAEAGDRRKLLWALCVDA